MEASGQFAPATSLPPKKQLGHILISGPSKTHCQVGHNCFIRCGPDEERILDVVPREDGARNSG